MQDSDHAQLVNRLPPKAGLLLGVTNPFFEKSCVHWPHVLSLGRRMKCVIDWPTWCNRDWLLYCYRNTNSPRTNSPALSVPVGPAPGWKTKTHRRYISKDHGLLKQIEHACSQGNDEMRKFILLVFLQSTHFRLSWSGLEASLNLRRHFLSRSTQLITPLARYLNTLIPTPTEVKHARKASEVPPTPPTPSTPSTIPNHSLRLKPFNSANFFASLKTHGSILPFKSSSKKTEFYERCVFFLLDLC